MALLANVSWATFTRSSSKGSTYMFFEREVRVQRWPAYHTYMHVWHWLWENSWSDSLCGLSLDCWQTPFWQCCFIQGSKLHHMILACSVIFKNWIWGCICLTLKAPTTTKFVCFCRQLKCLEAFQTNSVDWDQTAPTGAVWSGSTLFISILNFV